MSDIDFKDTKQLLGYAIKTIGQVAVLRDMTDEQKSAFIVNAVKHAINTSKLSDEEKAQVLPWCDAALPYIIQAVQYVTEHVSSEADKIKTVVLADMKKCCFKI
jgi:hypothetical protein